MSRIVIISDVHANLPALEAALATIDAAGYDAIYHLGDAITIGPFPAECLDLLLDTSHMRFLMGNHDAWFAHGLPHQMIHGDYAPVNTLYLNGRVTAVVDFELAAPDVHATDVAAGLRSALRLWQPEKQWHVGASLVRGYTRYVSMTPLEMASMSNLLLLRDIASTIWWLGRELAEGAPRIERLRELRQLTAWLHNHAREIEQMVRDAHSAG